MEKAGTLAMYSINFLCTQLPEVMHRCRAGEIKERWVGLTGMGNLLNSRDSYLEMYENLLWFITFHPFIT